jgi:ABC-2 type transport system permease protein
MIPIIFVMPVVQLLILANAANFEIQNVQVHIMDFDQSSSSRELIGKIQAFSYFEVSNVSFHEEAAFDDFASDKASLVIRIPHKFETDLIKNNKASVQIIINAINGSAAGIINVYVNSIIRDFNSQLITEWKNEKSFDPGSRIHIDYSYWYNPEMNYKTFMVPGILVMLVTMIGMFLAGMNIVREKEIGTIEQLNVTPIKKHQFIIGKLLPFWFIALFELSFGTLVAKLIFHIPILGNIGVIYLFASVYLLVILGFGLLVSTITNTQQQAMFISWFFMVIFILMSGLFTPIENMPVWAQNLTKFNPIAYFVEVMRMVMLKGAELIDIRKQLIIMLIYGFSTLGLATLRYRKTN